MVTVPVAPPGNHHTPTRPRMGIRDHTAGVLLIQRRLVWCPALSERHDAEGTIDDAVGARSPPGVPPDAQPAFELTRVIGLFKRLGRYDFRNADEPRFYSALYT